MRTVEALNALGSAWRGDWSDCDGRTIRDQLESIATLVRQEANGRNVAKDVDDWASAYDLCLGCGSWVEHCRCAEENQ